MFKDEESKKIAKISPTKIERSMSKEELDAHKKQLEQYYSGENVDDVDKIISDSKSLLSQLNKPLKFNIIILVFLIVTVILGLILRHYV